MSDATGSAKLDPMAIEAIFAPIDQCQLPGAAVAVAIEDVPVYRKGFGLATIELPIALSPSMRMRIGSTTKHFVCLAFMLLCEEGRASLDDEIGRHVPDLHAASRHVTMRQLMCHTSGIRDALAVIMMMHGIGRPTTDKEMLAYYKTIDDVDFVPGTEWSYNNGAYVLLTAAIERITGEMLDEVLRKRIFEPAGMYDTMLRRWDSDFVTNSASLHMVDEQGRYSRSYMGMELSGAGGMVSTMDDMLRWMRHMEAPVVGTSETWQQMTAPQYLANGVSTYYGFGLRSRPYRGVATLAHSGGVFGGNSMMIKVPAARLDISVAVNRADLSAVDLACKIIDACVDGLEPVASLRAFERRTGFFVSRRDGRVVELTVRDNAQFVSVHGASPVQMSLDAEGALRMTAASRLRTDEHLVQDETGLRLVDFGHEHRLDPVDSQAGCALGSYAGCYRADAIDTTADVVEGHDGPRLRTKGRHGTNEFRLEPVAPRIWKATACDAATFTITGIATFDRDGNGFELTADTVRGIRFVRK
jgi:CubicO group peptidase (beta-lactamase class C family)